MSEFKLGVLGFYQNLPIKNVCVIKDFEEANFRDFKRLVKNLPSELVITINFKSLYIRLLAVNAHLPIEQFLYGTF